PEFGDDYSVLEEELDHWPVKKLAGIVVVLEPQFDGKGEAFKNLQGFELAGNTVIRDDKEVFYPRWNLVFEAYQTFWENTLQIYNSVGYTSHPIQVTRVASDSYQFMAVQNHDAIDLEPYMDFIPTVAQEIERLGSEERYDEYFGEGKQRIEN